MRLKQALRQIKRFRSIVSRSSLSHRQDCAEMLQEADVVFLSHRLDCHEVSHFVKTGKESARGAEVAYVLLQDDSASASDITIQYLTGFDGMLLEPYSVDVLAEIIRIAEEVKRAEHDRRFEKALRLLVRELRAQVSHLAVLQKAGHAARISREVLHDMCSVLRELEPDKLEMYFDIICEVLGESEAPRKEMSSREYESYRGMSERARKKSAVYALSELREVIAA